MNKIFGNYKLLRYGLLGYLSLFLVYLTCYISFHLKFFKIDWNKYRFDEDYARWVEQKVLPLGVARITGSETKISDFWLFLPFLLGIIVSAYIFFKLWKLYLGRSFFPLLVAGGYIIPILPFNDSNLIARLVCGLSLVALGTFGTVMATAILARRLDR